MGRFKTIFYDWKSWVTRKPSIARFFLTRYVISLIVVSLLTTLAIYYLLYSSHKSAIELSLEATEEFLMQSIQYEVRNYEFESLQDSINSFRSSLDLNRIEVVGPFGKTIADTGEVKEGLDPSSTVPIVSQSGAIHGEINIWYGDAQHAWATSSKNTQFNRAVLSVFFFLLITVGYSVFFFMLIRKNLNEPLADLVQHMNSSQDLLSNTAFTKIANFKKQAIPIPSQLTSFQETEELGLAYSRLEQRWLDADNARSDALANERYQRSILLEVLNLAKITVAFIDDARHIRFIGTPVQESIEELLISSELDEDRILANASKLHLSTQNTVFKGNQDNYSLIVEIEDKNLRKWSLHKAVIDSKKAIILREVTQERGLEQALLRSEKLKSIGSLSSSIAHDFNNIISTILVNMELIKNLVEIREDVPSELFEGIESSAKGIAGRISGIRRLALENDVHLERVNQDARLRELERFVAPTLGANIKLNLEINNTSAVMCDSNEFESCIVNLLLNAKQAMNGTGEITIRTRLANNKDLWSVETSKRNLLAIDIEDSGPGVPREIANLIFDPFYSTRKLTQGTGLGLAQVQAFCIRSGGGVYVDRHRNKGALFTLLLPIDQHANTQTRPALTTEIMPIKDTKVFILDDNKLLAKSTCKLLECYHINAHACETLDELKTAIKTENSHIILLSDVHMPDCNFQDVISFANSENPSPNLAFYSGNEESLASISRQFPEIQTISKPFETKKLVKLIHNLSKTTETAAVKRKRKTKKPSAPASILH